MPNFLEAQVRAKISRAKADMRTISLAIETYQIDNNRPPIGIAEGTALNLWASGTQQEDWVYNRLTTPVAYMSSVPLDPFNVGVIVKNLANISTNRFSKSYPYQAMKYYSRGMPTYKAGFTWQMRCTGPDRVVGMPQFVEMVILHDPGNIYDATNGTTSYGDFYRTNKGDINAGNLR